MLDFRKVMVNLSSMPRISIITPSLNQGNYIEETIVSVLNQTFSNLEYIIMDGGSTDNTLEVINKYKDDPRFFFYSEQDRGQYDAVNRGFLRASGDILGWINADDVYTDRALERVADVFEKTPATEIVYGQLYSFKTGQRTRRRMFCRNFSYRWLRRYCYPNPSVTFVKKSIIKKERLLIDISVPTYGDWDWYLRMAKKGKNFKFIPETLGYFRIHSYSRIMMMNQRQSRIERIQIKKRHGIPLGYMNLWIDHIIPWVERFDNFFLLLKHMKFNEMIHRFGSASSNLWHGFRRRLL